MDKFSQSCSEAIGHYVYALIDPRLKGPILARVFYVGMGVKNRCHAHARQELEGAELADGQMKLATIRVVRDVTGRPPPVFIVAHGLERAEALRLEAILIATLDFRPLTNAVRGQGDRDVWLPADELDARHAKSVSRSEIAGTVLFVSLNGGPHLLPYPEIKHDPVSLRRRTLGAWAVAAKRATRVDLVVGVYLGLTRCAYRVGKDQDGGAVFTVKPPSKERGRSRVRFEGELLPDWPHLLRRVEDDRGSPLTVFPPRSACRLV